MTITFSTTHSDDNPQVGSVRRLLVHRAWPSTTRSSPISSRPASPSRPRRPGGRLPGRDRHVRGRGPGRGRRGARAAGASRPGRRGSCAARSSARRRPWAATATARLRSRRRAAGAVESRPRGRGRRWSPSRRRWRSAWRAQPRVKISRVLTLANTGSATVHVSIALSRDRADDGDASVALTDAPSSISRSLPGASVPVPLTLVAHGLPDQTTVIGGWMIVSIDGGGTLRVPWALSRSDDLAAGLIGKRGAHARTRAADGRRQRRDQARARARLGASRTAPARLEIAPVQRLSVDLYRDSHLLGRLVERHELLPGQLPLRHHRHRPDDAQGAHARHLPARDRCRLGRRRDE